MPRLAGINLPENKKIKIALSYIYGIGRRNCLPILKKAQLDPEKRTQHLNDEELARLQKAVESVPVEGVLRKTISENIKRLKQIGTYRGMRHSANLPVRGQRTRVNARTKRGKRMTVGALKKEMATREEADNKKEEKK